VEEPTTVIWIRDLNISEIIKMIPVYKPYLDGLTGSAIEAIQSGWISNHGKFLDLAANLLKEKIGAKFCILTANGTLATEALFVALKWKHPHVKKVYIPDYCFVAPYNCALRHFQPENIFIIPIHPETLNMDEKYLASIEEGSALVVVHNVGFPVDVSRLAAARPDLIILEDNCEGFCGTYGGNLPTGGFPGTLCSSLSFYANKNITTGEGGAFLTNDEEIYNHIKKVYSHGMTSTRYLHDVPASNWRMTNVQAGFLYDALRSLEKILAMKKRVWERYNQKLNFRRPTPSFGCNEARWMYCVIYEGEKTFDELEKIATEKGIEIRPFFYSVAEHGHLKNLQYVDQPVKPQGVPVMLPSYPGLTDGEIDRICEDLKVGWQ
jgi:perosamine synthetase